MSTITLFKGEQEIQSLTANHKFLIFTYKTDTLTLTNLRLVRREQYFLTDFVHSAPLGAIDSVLGGRKFQTGWLGFAILAAMGMLSGVPLAMSQTRDAPAGVGMAVLGFLALLLAIYKGRERLVGAWTGSTAMAIDVSPQVSDASPEDISAFIETLLRMSQEARAGR